MNGLGFRDWPDRLILKPGVITPLWIEFKRPGEEQTESQREIARKIAGCRQPVYVTSDAYEAGLMYENHRD